MSTASNPTQFEGARKSEAKSDAGLRTLLNANNLDGWTLPSALSVTVSRAHKKSFATSNEFKNTGVNTMSYILKPGADYVYGPDSYLMFKMVVTNTDTKATFGEFGSVLNIFKSIRLTHASGNEIEYTSCANLLNKFKIQYERTRRWRETTGSVMGCSDGDPQIHGHVKKSATTDAHTSHTEDTRRVMNNPYNLAVAGDTFCVPLSMLSEMFNADKLIPPYMLAGLRIELELEDPRIALQGFSDATHDPVALPTDLEIVLTNCEMHLDSHTLTDSVQKALARMSAMEGLDLHFPSWYHDRHQLTSASTTINVTKALSRVDDVTLVERLPADYAAVDASSSKDSFGSVAYAANSWQIAIGSMFFPSHSVSKAEFAYVLAQQGRDKDNGVGFKDFSTGGLGCYRGNMERSQILNGSGIAISATRGASVHLTSTVNNSIDVFVKHTRLVSVFLDNVVVRV